MSMKLEDRKGAGNWLKNARAKIGISQQTFSERARYCSARAVCMIESGQTRVSEWNMPLVASALEMEPSEVAKAFLKFYHPVFYKMLFGDEE